MLKDTTVTMLLSEIYYKRKTNEKKMASFSQGLLSKEETSMECGMSSPELSREKGKNH